MRSQVSTDGHTVYSGTYIKGVGPEGLSYRITEEKMPTEMYLGKLVFTQSEQIRFEPQKVKKILENGKFIGPSIADEDQMDY